MINRNPLFVQGRRRFILNNLPVGILFCLGGNRLLAMPIGQANQEKQKPATQKHKFQDDSGMSFEEVFKFAHRDHIEVMQFLAKEIGRNKELECIKIPFGLDFADVQGLSNELKCRLAEIRPVTLGQASLIEGMTPAGLQAIQLSIRMFKG